MSAGVLYVVATPIGNLSDLTPRAREILASVDLIAAEDTRRTGRLLRQHGIRRPLVAYYDAVERARAPGLVAKLRGGESIALVSDAGTPGISDPGYHVVRAAAAAGIDVVPVPGASSVTALLSVAGIACERFVFEGFLPTKAGPRRRAVDELRGERRAIVLLESPRRLGALLRLLAERFGEREAVVGRELTKRFEEILRGTLPELAERVGAGEPPKGEIVLVVAGLGDGPAPGVGEEESEDSLDDAIRAGLADGLGVRELSARLARERGCPRRAVYARAVQLAKEPRDHQPST